MNRVAITGLGVVSPLGNEIGVFRENLLAGKSGISNLTLFSPGSLPSRIAAECRLDRMEYKDRKINFAISAVDSAVAGSGAALEYHEPDKRGLSIGIGLELFDMNDMSSVVQNDGHIPEEYKECFDFLQTPSDICCGILSERFDLRMPAVAHISACAAGSDAIGHAFMRIRRGEATLMIAGGADSMINPMGFGGFCKLGALSTRNEEPQRASRPFDLRRDGFVLGEGAGMLVLENYEHAEKRGAKIYAEVMGYGNSFDAHAISEPHPEARGAVQAMRKALKMAGIGPEKISYINAHGTSTPKNDSTETLAIKTLFGKIAHEIPVSSTKSMIGHLISAAGAVEAIAAITCAGAGKVHPTVNLESPDELCDLDYVPGVAREHKVGYFLSNSFGFGGQNASLVFRME